MAVGVILSASAPGLGRRACGRAAEETATPSTSEAVDSPVIVTVVRRAQA